MTAERLAEYKARFRAAIDQMDKTEQFAAEAACPSLDFLREMDEEQLDTWATARVRKINEIEAAK